MIQRIVVVQSQLAVAPMTGDEFDNDGTNASDELQKET